MAFCTAIFCAASAFAANEQTKKVTFDLRRGTVQGNFNKGDVRMAGTMQAPPPVRRKLSMYNRNRQYYKTPRGRYQLARSFGSRINSNYGNLNQ